MDAAELESAVTAVVVNHNGGQAVINCLSALSKQVIPLEQIILVDNASTDGSPAMISSQFPQVDLVRLSSNIGLSKARNIGLQKAGTGLVLIIDDDVYVDKDCIRLLRRSLARYRTALVCPRVVFYPDKTTIQCDGAAPHFTGTLLLKNTGRPRKVSSHIAEVQACIGACMLLDRKTALSIGCFDEEYFFYFEDLEFSLRMRSMGYDILCDPRALVFHDRGGGTPLLSFRGEGEYPEARVFLNIRNRLMTVLMHYRLCTLTVLLPALLVYEIAVLLISLKRGWGKHWVRAVSSVCAARGHIREQRKQLSRLRRRSDKDLLSGGELPLSKGFISNEWERLAVNMLSFSLNFYWNLVKRHIG